MLVFSVTNYSYKLATVNRLENAPRITVSTVLINNQKYLIFKQRKLCLCLPYSTQDLHIYLFVRTLINIIDSMRQFDYTIRYLHCYNLADACFLLASHKALLTTFALHLRHC